MTHRVQKSKVATLSEKNETLFLVSTMGGLMEDNECSMRNEIEIYYPDKTKQVLNSSRLTFEYKTKFDKQKELTKEYAQFMAAGTV